MHLPTKVAVAIAESAGIDELFEDVQMWTDYLGRFQRLCLVSDYDTAVKALVPHMSERVGMEGNHKTALELIHRISKEDVLGLAVEALVNVTQQTNGSSKDKIAAAAILNELYGDKELISEETLTDKLIVNLVGKGE